MPSPTRFQHRLLRKLRPRKRKGAIIVLAALLMIVMMAMLAFTVDLGYIAQVQTEMDRAVDAGALAGAGALIQGTAEAEGEVRSFVGFNEVGGTTITGGDVIIETGHWVLPGGIGAAGYFSPTAENPSAIRVAAQLNHHPLMFARTLGHNDFSVQSEAVAVYQPRDILLVLDYSASMNDDSELRSIDTIGREAVEQNLQEIHQELGSPSFGSMEFEPKFALVVGDQPVESPHMAHIEVEYRYASVYVTSTKPINRVRIYFTSGGYQSFNDVPEGLFQGTGGNAGKSISKVRVRSGHTSEPYTSSNRYQETFDLSSSVIVNVIKQSFGLNESEYPYASGSFTDYVNYVRERYRYNNSNYGDSYNYAAAYRYKFGYLNLVNYWLERKPKYSQVNELWATSEQPITAVKEATALFLAYLQEGATDDKLGLAIYTSSNDTAKLESPLTDNFQLVEDISRQRQAGHYDTMTNIGAGILEACDELDANARPGAFKMIVLMTDGIANLPGSPTQARDYAISQANVAAEKDYPIVTVSLGAGADTDLMDQISALTGGVHFNVPGGQSVEDYEEDLKEVFRTIAANRPLRLVQ